MNASGHITIGAVIGFVVAAPDLTLVTIVTLASLLPDIDHKRSTLGRYNPVACLMKHRGFAHTFIGSAVISLPFIYLSNIAWLCAFIGCVSHILADRFMSILPGKSRFRMKLW